MTIKMVFILFFYFYSVVFISLICERELSLMKEKKDLKSIVRVVIC